jgi:hypothetical protein
MLVWQAEDAFQRYLIKQATDLGIGFDQLNEFFGFAFCQLLVQEPLDLCPMLLGHELIASRSARSMTSEAARSPIRLKPFAARIFNFSGEKVLNKPRVRS